MEYRNSPKDLTTRAWRKANPEKVKEQKKRHYIKHRNRLMEKERKKHAEGMLKDSPSICRKAAEYLSRYNDNL